MTRWQVRPLRFAAVGLVNTALGLGVIFAAKAFAGLGDLAANSLGYAVGLVAAFALNRRWTFRHRGSARRAWWRFTLAFGSAYALNLLCVFAARDLLWVDSYAAQALGTIPYTLFFYLASAYYVFPNPSPAASAADPGPGEVGR